MSFWKGTVKELKILEKFLGRKRKHCYCGKSLYDEWGDLIENKKKKKWFEDFLRA